MTAYSQGTNLKNTSASYTLHQTDVSNVRNDISEAEKGHSPNPNTPIANTEIPVANSGKTDRYIGSLSNTPQIANTEKTLKTALTNPIPAPTPPADVVDELCTKAAREAEASRLLIAGYKDYIDALERKSKVQEDIQSGQNVLSKLKDEAIALKEKNLAKADEEIANKQKEIDNLKKQLAEAQKNKCGLKCQAIRVGFGVIIGVLLL